MGKGSFVATKNLQLIREEQLKEIEYHIQQAVTLAQSNGISFDELSELLKMMYGEDIYEK